MRSLRVIGFLIANRVLILICVEASVWDHVFISKTNKKSKVLILVCVEFSMWETQKMVISFSVMVVLILVCVEFSMWDKFAKYDRDAAIKS